MWWSLQASTIPQQLCAYSSGTICPSILGIFVQQSFKKRTTCSICLSAMVSAIFNFIFHNYVFKSAQKGEETIRELQKPFTY
jgi:hypothetical protein